MTYANHTLVFPSGRWGVIFPVPKIAPVGRAMHLRRFPCNRPVHASGAFARKGF